MIVALTGGTGQLGTHAIDALLAAGHTVRVLVRPEKAHFLLPLHQQRAHTATVSPLDTHALAQAIQGCDAVVHAAAALTGDEASQQAITVEGTRALLTAMTAAGVRRLVGIGSLSVYDHTAVPVGGTFNENTPLETQPALRDVYARCKLAQDHLFAQFAQTPGALTITLRPGIFYTERSLWQFALGKPLGARAWLVMGPLTPDCEVPLVHVKTWPTPSCGHWQRADSTGRLSTWWSHQPHRPRPCWPRFTRPTRTSVWCTAWWLHRLLASVAAPLMATKHLGCCANAVAAASLRVRTTADVPSSARLETPAPRTGPGTAPPTHHTMTPRISVCIATYRRPRTPGWCRRPVRPNPARYPGGGGGQRRGAHSRAHRGPVPHPAPTGSSWCTTPS